MLEMRQVTARAKRDRLVDWWAWPDDPSWLRLLRKTEAGVVVADWRFVAALVSVKQEKIGLASPCLYCAASSLCGKPAVKVWLAVPLP